MKYLSGMFETSNIVMTYENRRSSLLCHCFFQKKKKVIFADGFTRKVLADPINRSYPKKNCFLPFVRVFFQNFLLLWKMEKMVKIYYEENERVIIYEIFNYSIFRPYIQPNGIWSPNKNLLLWSPNNNLLL